jgi:hypothetical protein
VTKRGGAVGRVTTALDIVGMVLLVVGVALVAGFGVGLVVAGVGCLAVSWRATRVP